MEVKVNEEKLYRTISEVSNLLQVPSSVLRFWETQFTQISPLKREGHRRLYRSEDIHVIAQIRDLLYKDGLTIKGAIKYLKEHKKEESQNKKSIQSLKSKEKDSFQENLINELKGIQRYLSEYIGD